MTEMIEQMERLQREVVDLQKQNSQLKREASMGGPQEILKTMQLPPLQTGTLLAGGATVMNGTMLGELGGLQAMLKELRKVKAELQGKEEEVEHLHKEVRFRDARMPSSWKRN